MARRSGPCNQMPHNFFPADRKWIHEQLSMLTAKTRVKIAEAYNDAYLQALDNDSNENTRTTSARREANTRLRLYVNKVSRVFC